MDYGPVFSNHDITIVPIFNLHEVSNKAVTNKSM